MKETKAKLLTLKGDRKGQICAKLSYLYILCMRLTHCWRKVQTFQDKRFDLSVMDPNNHKNDGNGINYYGI